MCHIASQFADFYVNYMCHSLADIAPQFSGSHASCINIVPQFAEKFYSLLNFPLSVPTSHFNFSTIMSTDWSVLFDETLAKYVQQYIEARGDPDARAQILQNCQKDITESSLHEKQDIELPEHLCRVNIIFY